MDKQLHIGYGSITDTGIQKEFNTDAITEFKILNGHAFVLCDGHDGKEGHGALASKLIAENIKKYFYNRSYKDMANALTNAITFANIALFELIEKTEKYAGIGSTLAIAIYREGKLYYAYAGDSRIYAYRDNKLQALTRDHIDNNENPADANVTVLLGKSKDIKFGVCKKPLAVEDGDVFLLCTDGISDQISDDEIAEILEDSDKAPEHKSRDLIELAKEKGGNDCASVHILELNTAIEPIAKPKKNILKPLLYIALALVGISALAFGAMEGIKYLNNRPAKELLIEEPVIDPTPEIKPTDKAGATIAWGTTEENTEPVQEIEEPEKENPVIVADNPAPKANTNEPVFHSHKIVYGENLYRLGLRYNVSQNKLIEINGSKAKNLVAGSVISIPVKAIHKVKKGESYSVISDMYNTKIKLICTASKINESNALAEGQTLIIPMAK